MEQASPKLQKFQFLRGPPYNIDGFNTLLMSHLYDLPAYRAVGRILKQPVPPGDIRSAEHGQRCDLRATN
jgi:hypothetical protein